MRRPSALSRNHYFVIGLLLGLVLSCYIPQDIWELVQQEECPQEAAENLLIERFGQDFEPHLNLINKPLAAKKPVKNVLRPRYYSSELGIREKIFIGVMTSQENINSYATAFNRTTAHLVNKIKFFINADSVKTNYQLKNIVGFTDTRESRRPFYVIKYIADNYLDEYDYFLLVPDNVYVDARKLNALLYHMSITFDLYMGVIRVTQGETGNGNGNGNDNGNGDGNGNGDDENAAPVERDESMNDSGAAGVSDRNYCDLEAGILLSSSVIRKMRNNLDRCVRIGITNDHSVNIGRCVKYASRVAGCQESFQGMRQYSYALNTKSRQYKDLSILAKEPAFLNATTVYPVQSPEDFYRLHAYYSKHHLDMVQQRGYALEQKSYRIANGSISNKILEIRWPLGVPPPSAPETRHDMLTWQLLNETHSMLPNSDHAVAPLSRIEALDFAKVLEITLQYAAQKYPKLRYESLHSAYRKFDATRGMDYQLHLNLYEGDSDVAKRRRLLLKSFEVVKPLGRVEVVPSPYVTESTRIAILVPAFEHQVPDALDFVAQYERICMHNQDNTFLLLIFLYRLESPSKGDDDPFKSLKKLALDLSSKYKTDGSRIAWVSIRLPEQLSTEPVQPQDWLMHASMYGPRQLLSLAVADLALPKLGLESLVLLATPSMLFRTDFLNRVRMNTIQGFQVYAPIGFQLYPCNWAHFCKECDTCDISQSSGYFDRQNQDVIAFYSRDYVQARKLLDPLGLPIMRSDLDIEQLLLATSKPRTSKIESILDMFVAAQHTVHILRAVEPHLRFGLDVRNHLARGGSLPPTLPQSCGGQPCIHLASRKQIGDAIIRYEDKSILQK
ncbi:PREDICTED: chondroitin sulfate synthase 2 [Drosophila arizonae]|uniref:Hexosyltransferase n=1 Tax=Drosophila arizonae TaxID=7263 RepID=A0ABM1PW74_DROAR|nr:PREDICTED: chondroitin sulfate synthase 2 [Drosophila arizonae]